jgi:hypothetical protein
MPKIIVTESSTDPALIASGKAMVVAQTSQSTSRIETTPVPPKYHVQVLSSEMRHDEELQYEVAKIRVTPIANMRNFAGSIRSDFSSGERSNHFFKLPNMVDLGETQMEGYSTSTSQASYSLETIFNYISEEYDSLQVGISEYNLYTPLDTVSKEDFLNVRNRNTQVVNFGRGNQMQNFVVPTFKIQQGTDASPYYNHLRINQRLDNGISNFALKLGLFDELLQDYLFSEKTSGSFSVQQGRETQEQNFGLYSIENFLTSDRELDIDNFFGIREATMPSRMSLHLRKLLMKGFLKDASALRTESPRGTILKPGFRRFENIYNNVESHKEVFCYSIAKHENNVSNATLLQTMYAPAMRDSTPIVDTQVKYGKTYAYKVTGHYMVVGNRYSYSNIQVSSDPSDPHAIITVTNRPSIVMMPFDIFTKTVNVVQKPPVFPQVSFKTKNDSAKTMMMYLSQTKTEVNAPFVTITREDQEQLQAMYRLPGSRDVNGNFKFKTYGDQGLFEVFRLNSPPNNYSDFRDAKIGEISMPFETMDAVFKDTVVPNKRYYYMFRAINQKGLVSNPTVVYETTLLVDADDSKVVVETYQFPKPRDAESSIHFRKLLRITPSVENVLLDESQPALFNKTSLVGTLDNLKLGINDKSVWGRKFKIRVRSKTSGKMIDIILNVDLTKNKSEEEF